MSAWAWVMVASIAICAMSAGIAFANLRLLGRPARRSVSPGESVAAPCPNGPQVSVCVPARNESANIEACLRSLLAQHGVSLEVLVYDDDSTDGTGEIVARLSAEDPRIRAVPTVPLPPGWNGKQHGCQRMGEAAHGRWLLFTDADVRFEPDAVALSLAEASRLRATLVSTFPRQITGSFLERLVVPMIHFILLSYLPMGFMRRSMQPSASAGCGQFLLVERSAWKRAGGHASFRDSMHDGIKLPRRIRETGGRTDLFDGTEVVSCRMYRDAASCWRGFAKNAYEGLGSFGTLCVFTLLHVVGHLLPWVVLARAAWSALAGEPVDRAATALAAGAISLALVERAALAIRFQQSWLGVALHPLAIALMTAIQWHSFALALRGRREWRGRVQGSLREAGASAMISRNG